MERKLGGCGYLLHLLFVIYGDAMGIAAVTETGECGWLIEEVETDGDILWLAACDGSYKPFRAFAFGHYVVITCLGGQYAGFVPCGGYRGNPATEQVVSTELIRTSQSWDGVELPDYLQGRPELVAVKYVVPAGKKLRYHWIDLFQGF